MKALKFLVYSLFTAVAILLLYVAYLNGGVGG
jgi:hypothetical protein